MAITEPEAGSDSAAIRTTARARRRRVRAQRREDLRHLRRPRRPDRRLGHARPPRGRAAIKSFVVERDNPGLKLDRLEHKLGIRASDTANFILAGLPRAEGEPARRPRDRGREGLRRGACRPSTTPGRWSPAMAVGVARAALERDARALLAEAGVDDRLRRPRALPARRGRPSCFEMEADYEAARLLTLHAAWMADNGQAELAPGLDGEGEGGPHLRRRRPRAASSSAAASATARTSCWRSGPATRRSSTSSRAPSRSSS